MQRLSWFRFLVWAICAEKAASYLPSAVAGPRLTKHRLSSPVTVLRATNTVVALTRESGKNGKFASLLGAEGISTVEVNCIEHGVGVDRPALPAALRQPWGYVVCTSPQAAMVLLQGWAEMTGGGTPEEEEEGKRLWKVASVGSSTSAALRKGGLTPDFEPSKATAATLAQELPVMVVRATACCTLLLVCILVQHTITPLQPLRPFYSTHFLFT